MVEERAGFPIYPYKSAAAFEKWLERNHESSPGIWVKIGKKANPAPSLTYDEAVEVGLCFGWIDGLKNRYDDDWFIQRFTPRRPKSVGHKRTSSGSSGCSRRTGCDPRALPRWRPRRPTAAGNARIPDLPAPRFL